MAKETAAEKATQAVAEGLGGKELTAADINNWSVMVPSASDEQLRNVDSYEDAMLLAEEINGVVSDISEKLGTGFIILEDKDKLVKTEFVAILWRFSAGTFGGFVSMAVVTKGGDKYIVNDGSAGIFEQLRELSAMEKQFGGMKVPRGLRVSEYATCFECGVPRTAEELECSRCGDTAERRATGHTYYLDTTPADKA